MYFFALITILMLDLIYDVYNFFSLVLKSGLKSELKQASIGLKI